MHLSKRKNSEDDKYSPLIIDFLKAICINPDNSLNKLNQTHIGKLIFKELKPEQFSMIFIRFFSRKIIFEKEKQLFVLLKDRNEYLFSELAKYFILLHHFANKFNLGTQLIKMNQNISKNRSNCFLSYVLAETIIILSF